MEQLVNRWLGIRGTIRKAESFTRSFSNLGVRPLARVWREIGGKTNITKWPLRRGTGRGGEEISGWHTVVRQKCWLMAAR